MQPCQEGTVLIGVERGLHLPLVVQIYTIVIADQTKGVPQEAQIPHAHIGKRNFVLLSIAIGVLGLESAEHLHQGLGIRGHVQAQGVQPGLVDPHGIVVLQGIQRRQGGNGPIRQRNGRLPVGMLRQQCRQIRHAAFDIRPKVQELARLIITQDFFRAQLSLEQHLRQLTTGEHAFFFLLPLAVLGGLIKGKVYTCFFFHSLEEKVVFPHMSYAAVIITSHGEAFLRHGWHCE